MKTILLYPFSCFSVFLTFTVPLTFQRSLKEKQQNKWQPTLYMNYVYIFFSLHKWLLLSWDPVLPPPVQDTILTPSPPICICMFQVVVTWLALIAWPRRKWLRPTLVWRPLPIVICNTSASKASEKFLVSILTMPRSLSQRSNMIWRTTYGKDTALRYDNACQTPL